MNVILNNRQNNFLNKGVNMKRVLNILILMLLTSMLSAETKYVSANSLNVRSGPGAEHSVVAKLNKGESVSVKNEQNGWSLIGQGWVASQYLSANLQNNSQVWITCEGLQELIDLSDWITKSEKQFVGKYYKYWSTNDMNMLHRELKDDFNGWKGNPPNGWFYDKGYMSLNRLTGKLYIATVFFEWSSKTKERRRLDGNTKKCSTTEKRKF